jgi:predicted nucleic acid-binding protein
MIVVADASPLIFLAKIRQLSLVHSLVGADIRIPRQVCREVLSKHTGPAERAVLEPFVRRCTVTTVPRVRPFAAAMSAADGAALTLAIGCGAGVLLCDERVTRTAADAEGVRCLGNLGVLRAMRSQFVTPSQALHAVDQLVGVHNFRIGIELYQAVRREIEGAAPGANS